MQSAVILLGWPEIIGLLVIVLVLVGAKHIPDMFKGMGHGLHEFIQATREVEDEVAKALKTEADAGDAKGFHLYGSKFWFIVTLGVAALWAVALWLRQLLA